MQGDALTISEAKSAKWGKPLSPPEKFKWFGQALVAVIFICPAVLLSLTLIKPGLDLEFLLAGVAILVLPTIALLAITAMFKRKAVKPSSKRAHLHLAVFWLLQTIYFAGNGIDSSRRLSQYWLTAGMLLALCAMFRFWKYFSSKEEAL